jgi:hypothetical protein
MSALEFQDTVPGEGEYCSFCGREHPMSWLPVRTDVGLICTPAKIVKTARREIHDAVAGRIAHPTRARTCFAKPSTTMPALDGSDSADSLPTVGDVVWFWLGLRIRTITWLFVFAIMGGAAIGWGSLAWVVVRRWLA